MYRNWREFEKKVDKMIQADCESNNVTAMNSDDLLYKNYYEDFDEDTWYDFYLDLDEKYSKFIKQECIQYYKLDQLNDKSIQIIFRLADSLARGIADNFGGYVSTFCNEVGVALEYYNEILEAAK